MLILAHSLRDLRFGELMMVYTDSNREAASDRPSLPDAFALQLAEQDMYQYMKDVFFTTSGSLCAIWEEQGRYVSALRLEPYRDGFLLEALETAPDCRKKGYAASLIRAVQRYLTTQGGTKLYSHVDKRNQASLKTHESCGFSVISDRAVYIDGSVDYRCCTMCYEAQDTASYAE